MGYNDSQLTPPDMPIYGFNGAKTKVEGIIQLPMTMGQEPCEVTQMLNFLVIKVVSSYNAILGRTEISAFQAIASIYHLEIKFPSRNGVGQEKGDQQLAQSCYVSALRPNGIGGQVLPIEDMDVREDEERRVKPAEDLILFPLDIINPEKVTYVGASLQKPLKGKIVTFVQENNDVFAWIAADIPGIDPQLITHKLNIDPMRKTVMQKKRIFAPKRQEAIKQEVEKLLEAGFIEEIQYP